MMVERTRPLRICLVASAGGHLSQLLKLSKSWAGHDTFCITTKEMVKERLGEHGNAYFVGECNRHHPLRVVAVLARCAKIIFREKPHVVISTGAAAGCICCFLAKLLRASVIWVDSIANVERVSLSGRIVRHIADLFLVQWPDLADRYKNAEFVGSVL
ncbi:MAG: hypothetical protein JSU70_23370 [Phycisphaerales bacterium]|nr:MAG: hypothetical protein JSU70_23370 [Phycisphaerales bacterium]